MARRWTISFASCSRAASNARGAAACRKPKTFSATELAHLAQLLRKTPNELAELLHTAEELLARAEVSMPSAVQLVRHVLIKKKCELQTKEVIEAVLAQKDKAEARTCLLEQKLKALTVRYETAVQRHNATAGTIAQHSPLQKRSARSAFGRYGDR